MKFKLTRIPPSGRNKYGNYLSSGNISKMVISYENNGNTTTSNPSISSGSTNNNKKNYAVTLSKYTGTFEWDDIVALSGQTDSINVIGYGDLVTIPVYIGDLTKYDLENQEDVPQNRNYDVTGIVDGLSISVVNNGTSATTINITADENIKNTKGTLKIPCNIYTGEYNKAPYLPSVNSNGEYVDDIDTYEDFSDWVNSSENVRTIWLEYNYTIVMNAVNNYHIELTNEIAGVNCDSDGNILSGAVLPTGKAILFIGNVQVARPEYGLNFSAEQEVYGVSINTQTGVLTFGSNFSFEGTNLELSITARDLDSNYITSKIMSIYKIYSIGGEAAVNRWIVTNYDVIQYDPNTGNVLPEKNITAKVMKQVGDGYPIEDDDVILYYGWDSEIPYNTYNGPIEIEVGRSYLRFGLKDNGGNLYESETIPVIKNGINGNNGQNGKSVYTLVLSNTNASVNCDSQGNVISGAVLPSCTAQLFYGDILESGVTFEIERDADGVVISGNKLYYPSGKLSFEGDVLEIKFKAFKNGALIATASMFINKIFQGTSYWLDFSSTCFIESDSDNSTKIEIKVYRQVGGNAPEELSYPSSECMVLAQRKNSSVAPVTSGTIPYIKGSVYTIVTLQINGVEVDRQTIPNIVNGEIGERGPSLRGPVDYNKISSSRRFCSGTLTSSTYPEDDDWIDIITILLPGETKRKTYRCIKSYNWSATDISNWNTIKNNWEEATEYDFVATEVLLAENAKIANFIFSDDRLISQATNEDGTPILELDGLTGTIKANKGILKAPIYYNFVELHGGDTINPNNPNVRVYPLSYDDTTTNPYIYLPELTPDIDGLRLIINWKGGTGRNSGNNLILYANKRQTTINNFPTYIYDSEFSFPFEANLDNTGRFSFSDSGYKNNYDEIPWMSYQTLDIDRITYSYDIDAYVELVANYTDNIWVILSKTKNGYGALTPKDKYVYIDSEGGDVYMINRKWGETLSSIGSSSSQLGRFAYDTSNLTHIRNKGYRLFRDKLRLKK